MEKYIYTNNKSISKELCNTIINMFEMDHVNKDVSILGNDEYINKNIRDSVDIFLPLTNEPDNNESNKFYKITKFLENELAKNLKEYSNKFEFTINQNENIHVDDFGLISGATNKGFNVIKYNKEKGKYIYHNDFICDYEKKKYRVITYLWYLNTVEEGGETEFWGTHIVKPEEGKLILFPACWPFPHRDKMPLSHDKYIITGWLYLEE
jgi:hypothetical protein